MFKRTCIAASLFAVLGTFSALAQPQNDARRAIALADYIAGDYAAAVAVEGNRIVSKEEYAEMQEFSSLIGTYLSQLHLGPETWLVQLHHQLALSIDSKAPVEKVIKESLKLRDHIVKQFSVPTHPVEIPDLERGKHLYQQSCVACHGPDGRADTVTAKQLSPPPRPFSNPDVMDMLSPFKAFNTITFGIENTGMSSYSILSETDRWALASYIFTLRQNLPQPVPNVFASISWKEAMEKSDGEILQKIRSTRDVDKKGSLMWLSQIRHMKYASTSAGEVSQRKKRQLSALSGVETAQEMIEESIEHHRKGNSKEALDASVSAYLDGFERSEPILVALGQSKLVTTVEQAFMRYRSDLRKKTTTIESSHQTLTSVLGQAETELRSSRELSKWSVVFGSFLIIFREGLEAILLCGVILSVLSSLGAAEARKWFHRSWVAALVAGGLTWVVAGRIISGVEREGIEGWVSLLAAAVLIYVSFWLLARYDAKRGDSYCNRLHGVL